MDSIWSRTLSCYHCICWSAALATVLYCISVYIQNEDLCIVDYKQYYENKFDMLPTLSICLKDPVAWSKLGTPVQTVNASTYLNFLKGDYFSSEMLNIDYNSSILELSEYVSMYQIIWKNGSETNVKNNIGRLLRPNYAYKWHKGFYQCYELEIPHEKGIEAVWVAIKRGVLPPRNHTTLNYGMITTLHYPNHLFISEKNIKFVWPRRPYGDECAIRFQVIDVEVIKSRNTADRPCHDWENYDRSILKHHIEKTGRKAPYHGSNFESQLCSSKESMKNIWFRMNGNDSEMIPPCRRMATISYKYEESEIWEDSEKDVTWIGIIYLDEKFREVVQTRYSKKIIVTISIEFKIGLCAYNFN